MASGEEKAKAVHLALSGAGVVQIPAAGPRGRERTLWLLDQAAASELPSGLARRDRAEVSTSSTNEFRSTAEKRSGRLVDHGDIRCQYPAPAGLVVVARFRAGVGGGPASMLEHDPAAFGGGRERDLDLVRICRGEPGVPAVHQPVGRLPDFDLAPGQLLAVAVRLIDAATEATLHDERREVTLADAVLCHRPPVGYPRRVHGERVLGAASQVQVLTTGLAAVEVFITFPF